MWAERKVLIAEELAKGRYDIVSLQEVWVKYICGTGKIDDRLDMYCDVYIILLFNKL